MPANLSAPLLAIGSRSLPDPPRTHREMPGWRTLQVADLAEAPQHHRRIERDQLKLLAVRP
jgi:hypothetical protein